MQLYLDLLSGKSQYQVCSCFSISPVESEFQQSTLFIKKEPNLVFAISLHLIDHLGCFIAWLLEKLLTSANIIT